MASNSTQLSNLELKQLVGQRCGEVLIRERWIFGERHNECEAIFLRLDGNQWFVIVADEHSATWVMWHSTEEKARQITHDGDNRYRLRDATQEFNLSGLRIDNVRKQKLGDKIELCLEFSNATDLTVHYNLTTGESSLYFIKD